MPHDFAGRGHGAGQDEDWHFRIRTVVTGACDAHEGPQQLENLLVQTGGFVSLASLMRAGFWLVLILAVGCHRPPVAATGAIRVVSLAPSLTEIIYAIGAGECLVGRSSACKYPATVTNVPIAGDFCAPALEALAQAAPQVVLTVDMEDPNSVRAIERLGIQHQSIPCRTLADIPAAIRAVGKLVRREEAAEKLASAFQAELAGLRQQPEPPHRRRVFVEIWGDPIMTAGKRAFLTELISLAGGVNVAADVDRDYFQISPEAILARDPEVILILEAGNIDVTKRSGWPQLSAVKSNRIYRDLDRDLLEIPGPRVLAAIPVLRQCIGVERASHLIPSPEKTDEQAARATPQ
jgi:iron complex transport system substrate-binding protein